MSFSLILSVEREPEIARLTAPATASTSHWQPECFLFCELKQCCFRILTIAPLLMVDNFASAVHFTGLVSNLWQPTIFQSIATTFVCTFTAFVNASCQSAGWPWWPVVQLFSRKYSEYSTPNHIWFHCFRHGADLKINANGDKVIQD